jgi:hypothetical protein
LCEAVAGSLSVAATSVSSLIVINFIYMALAVRRLSPLDKVRNPHGGHTFNCDLLKFEHSINSILQNIFTTCNLKNLL